MRERVREREREREKEREREREREKERLYDIHISEHTRQAQTTYADVCLYY